MGHHPVDGTLMMAKANLVSFNYSDPLGRFRAVTGPHLDTRGWS